MTRDWVEWHRSYDDPASSLSLRLIEVSRLIRVALDGAAPGDIKVLSLCAGDARDLTLAATGHTREADLTGLVVELDPRLARAAATNLASLNTRVTVSTADAGQSDAFRSALPVDLLLLCGIFGNVNLDDVHTTVAAVPTMCRRGAAVIWTRHRREPDATPSIKQWFNEAGCTPVEFVSSGAGGFAIGMERTTTVRSGGSLPDRLFTFRDDLW